VTELFDIQTIGPVCNWKNLEWLVLGGHVVIMLIFSIPASFLIPNEAQDADLLAISKEKKEEVTVHLEEDFNQDILLI
jgi:hypothetical protein